MKRLRPERRHPRQRLAFQPLQERAARRSRRRSSGPSPRHGAAPRPCRRRRRRCAARPPAVASATACAKATVAASKGGVSKAPSGPFHTSVFTSAQPRHERRHRGRARHPGSSCRPGTAAIGDRLGSAAFGLSSARHHGVDRQHDLAARLLRPGEDLARGRRACSASCSDLPTPTPCAARNVLAIAPPITSTSTRPTRLPSSSSLVETLAPPTIAATGRAGLPSAASSASSSACISRPA